jgi:GTP-binding protein
MPFKIAIVGRPNVGKSTLFNRIVEKRIAITDDVSGTTRDRIYGESDWLNKKFFIIDTGGIDFEKSTLKELINKQVYIGIEEADLILFVIDGKTHLVSDDIEISLMLHKSKKPVICVINKVDDKDSEVDNYDSFSLGFDDYYFISAYHGKGIGDLLDRALQFYNEKEFEIDTERISFCIIGRPNVGKSSLVNAILNENRVVVSSIPGTTHDAIDSLFEYQDRKYRVVDTAGIMKKSKIDESVDLYSLLRAIDSIERCDVCLFMLDGQTGVIDVDKHVISYITDKRKAVVIVVNKWDLVEKETNTMKEIELKIKETFKFLDYAEIVFISALNKTRIDKIFGPINSAYENYHKNIKTSVLNEILSEAVLLTPPQPFNHKKAQFYYATQSAICPPTFKIFVNEPLCVHFSYERYLINQFNKAINFKGSPIVLEFIKKPENEV